MLGTLIDEKYRIDRLIGRGGMGSVFLADDVRSGQRVALKVIHAELPGRAPDIAERFAREAKAAGSVDTDHIARCLDAGTDRETGQPYMALEYLIGEDLHRVLRRTGPLLPDTALRITAQACIGLSCAHEAGVIHRDIKPANLFLAVKDDPAAPADADPARVVKLLDFGIAKIRTGADEDVSDSDALTRTGNMLGSPMYMSPEQARSVRNVDHRADLWSLGVVMYQSLAGRTPFNHIGGLGDLVLALWSEPPPPVQQFAPWIAPEIASILDRMLRLDPAERFQTAKEVFDAVTALLPAGYDLRESLLEPISDEARRRPAATYFRSIDIKQRAFDRARTGSSGDLSREGDSQSRRRVEAAADGRSSPLATTSGFQRPITRQPESVSMGAQRTASALVGNEGGSGLIDSASNPGDGRAVSPRPPLPSESEISEPGVIAARGVTTQAGVATSDSIASSRVPPNISSKRFLIVAAAGVAIGVSAVAWSFSRSGPTPIAQGVEPIAPPPSQSTSASKSPEVAPAPMTAEPAVSATSAPNATAIVSATAAVSASATTAALPKPSNVPVLPRPPVTASTTPATPTKPATPAFTDFGDRK